MRTALILLFSSFSLIMQAQAPFVPIGAQWTYTQHHYTGLDTNLLVTQCINDTVIQGRTCFKLSYLEGANDCIQFFSARTF